MERKQVTDIHEYFWMTMEQFVAAIPRGISSNLPYLTLLVQLPFWTYAQDHLQSPNSAILAQRLTTALTHISPVDEEFCSLKHLWTAVQFLSHYEGVPCSGYPPSLTLTITALSAGTLDRRVESITALNSLLTSIHHYPGLEETLHGYIESLTTAVYAEQHEQVLERYGGVLKWLQRAGGVDAMFLRHVVKAALMAQSMYSEAMKKLVLDAVDETWELSGVAEEIRTLQGTHLDKPALSFLTLFCHKVRGEHHGLIPTLLQLFSDLLHLSDSTPETQTAVMEAYIATIQCSEDAGTWSLQLVTDQLQKIGFDEPVPRSLEFLWKLLQGLSDSRSVIREYNRKVGVSFAQVALACCHRVMSVQEDWADEELRNLLGICDYWSQESDEGVSSILGISGQMLASPRPLQRSIILQFLSDSLPRPWCLKMLSLLFRDTDQVKYPSLYRDLTFEQYIHYRKLFFFLNQGYLLVENDIYIMRDQPAIVAISHFTRIILETLDLKVLKTAKNLLIELIVFALHRDQNSFLLISGLLLSPKSSSQLIRGLEMLFSLWEFQNNHKNAQKREKDLTEAVDYIIDQLPFPSLGTLPEFTRMQITEIVESFANKHNCQYFQVKITHVPDEDEEKPVFEMMKTDYNPVEMGVVLDELKKELVEAMGSTDPVVAKAAFKLVPCLLPTSRFLSTVSSLQSLSSSRDMTERLLILLALQHLSTSSDFHSRFSVSRREELLSLLHLLDQGIAPLELIKHYKHRLVMYCDALLGLIHLYYPPDELDPKSVSSILTLLHSISLYYTLDDTDPTLRTDLIPTIRHLLSPRNDLQTLLQHSDFPQFLSISLIFSRSNSFSEAICGLLCEFMEKKPELESYFSMICQDYVSKAGKNCEKSRWFFTLISHFSQINFQVPAVKLLNAMENAEKGLWMTLVEVAWKRAQDFTENQALQLTDNVLNSLFPLNPNSLCAFSCTSQDRTTCFNLLRSMSSLHPQICEKVTATFTHYNLDLSWRRPGAKWWSIDPVQRDTTSDYVGLTNLGATCYMNAVFQQLSLIPEFLQGVLSHSPQTDFLQAFQRLLINLRYKKKRCASLEALLPYLPNGPIDPEEQMDAEEFLNGFMSGLERELSVVGGERVVLDLFTGRMATQLTGQCKCGVSRTQTQTFMCLPLELSPKGSLEHSLASFTHSETLHGSNMLDCPSCGTRVVTESQQQFLHLPNILFIALRRFGFDMQTHRRYKVNAYCEFPMELDLTSITGNAGSFPEDYCHYSLRGVVIHNGMAEAGHYTSLIKCPDGNWLSADDTLLSPFDLSTLPSECFGDKKARVSTGKGFKLGKSAYILVYERQCKYRFLAEGEQLAKIDKMDWAGQRIRDIDAKFASKRSTKLKISTIFSPEYEQFLQKSPFFPLDFHVSYLLTVFLRRKSWWKDVNYLHFTLSRIRSDVKSISYWLSEVLCTDRILDEFVLCSVPMETKKAFVSVVKASIGGMTEGQRRLMLYRLLWRMEKMEEVWSEEVKGFFEVMETVVRAGGDAGRELEVGERLGCRLRQDAPIPAPLTAKDPIYSSEAYLGHPLPAYQTLSQSSSTAYHLGFQLSLLSLCPPHTPQTCDILWSLPLLSLFTAFERYQAAKFISQCANFPPISLLVTDSDQLNRTIDTLISIIRLNSGEMTAEIVDQLINVRYK